MSDKDERKELIARVLRQWYARDLDALIVSWLMATQHSSTPMLRMAVDEICASWTKSTRPQPGDVNAIANRQRALVVSRPQEGLLLSELEAQSRAWLEANKLPVTAENLMRQCRARIGRGHPRAPLSDAGWDEALAAGVVTHIPPRIDAPTNATSKQLIDLWRAGYGWCDEKRSFVPRREAVDLDWQAEENGTPFPPRSMSDGAIAGAHAQLVAGRERPVPRESEKSGGFERLVFDLPEGVECPF